MGHREPHEIVGVGGRPADGKRAFKGAIVGHVVDLQLVMDGNTVMVGHPLITNPGGIKTGGVVLYDLSAL